MKKEIKALYPKKATTYNNIPARILKNTFDICSPILSKIWREAVLDCNFPNNLKLADITATLMLLMPHVKYTIDRLVYYLLFQIFLERIMQNKLFPYLEDFLSTYAR